ncbi:hypothetical protein [Streptomyces lydicus]|uniref:hypothetical protein n=1 Tax=Streptomyces lydicus TaxID=47763 RepID=UPI00379F29D9
MSTFPCHLPPSPEMKLSPSDTIAVGFAARPPGNFGAAEEWVGDTARAAERIAVIAAAVIEGTARPAATSASPP